jgi:PPP family 3-phenylpropionic acid transporter
MYGSISFGAGGMLGNLLSGVSWEAVGPGLTFSGAAVLAAMGLLLVGRGIGRRRPVR